MPTLLFKSLRLLAVVLGGLMLVPGLWQAVADDASPPPAPDSLPERDREWLEEVTLLMSDTEREVFLSLEESYQRDHFRRRFWKVRDPFPQTGRNELRDAWKTRVLAARELYESLEGDPPEMMLKLGAPSRRVPVSCADLMRSLEIWQYAAGSDRISGAFTLVFIGRGVKGRLWDPRDGLRPLLVHWAPGTASDAQLAAAIRQQCIRGEDIVGDLAMALDVERMEENELLLPRPSDEWALAFRSRSTELEDDAELLPAELSLAFPGRHQSRTVVQSLLTVDRAEAALKTLGEHRSYNFLVDGEVIRKGELFDQFRYRFDLPEQDLPLDELSGGRIPLVLQRYLRPGAYRLVLKLEDLNGQRFFRREVELEVPALGVIQAAPVALPSAAEHALDSAKEPVVATTRRLDQRLAEANASIATGDHVIEILPLPEVLSVGRLRVQARATGEGIARVAFSLDGRPVMRKSKPPYSVELNLGDKPRLHTLTVTALDAEGRELASDEVPINAGPHRFALRLLEPQEGRVYRDSVRVHAEVEVPEGERLDRVELYMNETRLATLYGPPYEQPMLLPPDLELTYVRAVAFLRDGNKTEDVVFINAPDFVDEVDVQMVELFTSVVDRKGLFVEDLAAGDFVVEEDGAEQVIRRFELVRDLPIHAGIMLDTSISMVEEIRDVEKAAYRFLENVLTPRDRGAVVTFSDEPRLAVRFTNDKAVLAGGLAGLKAEGHTALYDSLIFTLHYFSGLKGKRAIVVLTDGEDSDSTYTFSDALDFARRTGVAIYVVGLDIYTSRQRDARLNMERLSRETGGECFFIERVTQLERVYDKVQEELRSQYLIAYQSTHTEGEAFRKVKVDVARKGLKAKTVSGYFPR